MSDERCETCRFLEKSDRNEDNGKCRRFPPVLNPVVVEMRRARLHAGEEGGEERDDIEFGCEEMDRPYLYNQPQTWTDGWCGEWQAKRTPLPVVEENPVLGMSILDALGNSRGIRAVWQGMRRAAGDPEDFDCTVADLVRMSDDEVVSLPGVGEVALLDALRALAKHGLKLKGD